MAHEEYIINHLSDTDSYKYTMGQVHYHQFPYVRSKWLLTIRSTNVKTAYLKDEVSYQLDHLCELKHSDDEVNFFASHNWYSDDYVEFLSKLRLQREDIHVARDGDVLGVWTDGLELHDQWFETMAMPIIQELWMKDQPTDYEEGKKKLDIAIDKYNALIKKGKRFTLSDFGTRRRAAFWWQDYVVRRLIEKCLAFVGTSNVYLAMKYGVKDIGTIAHQMFMLLQALARFNTAESQRATLDVWLKEYRGRLAILLSDTYGMDAFLRDCDSLYMKLSDGLRHDSDDPYLWCQIFLEVLRQMFIDPHTKTACFSDSLKDDDVVGLVDTFADEINVAIGQGTFLTNNVGGNPLNMVMKLDEVEGVKVVKLSDTAGKCNCKDPNRVNIIKSAFNYKPLSELSWMKNNPGAIKEYVAGILKYHRDSRVRRMI